MPGLMMGPIGFPLVSLEYIYHMGQLERFLLLEGHSAMRIPMRDLADLDFGWLAVLGRVLPD